MKLNAFLLMFLICSLAGLSQQADLRTSNYNLPNSHIAINGYDPVAYFTQNKALKGNKNYSVSYDGVIYYFANAEDKALFLKSPAKYEPQYGGWCAYAMGNTGEKVEVDPETFKVLNGKLFLFYNKYFTNTLNSWNKNEAALHAKADQNWMKLYPH